MGTFADQIATIDVTTQHTTSFEPGKIWYHNGVKAAKTGGSFYARASDFPDGIPGWNDEERFDNEAGLITTTAYLAVLTWRSQPFRKYKDEEGRDRVEYMSRWEKGMSIHTELLCMLQGMDEAVVWSMKGMTGSAVTGRGGILHQYQNGLLKEANKVKRGLPHWTFWLPISTKLQADGKIAYVDTGFGSFVTPPALHLPENAMDTLFVGADILARGEELLNEYAGWKDARRLPANTTEAEYYMEEQKALPAPKNAPVAYSPDDEL